MTEEEIKFLQFENKRLKEDLRLSNNNWKFENERLQLSLNARLEETAILAKKLQAAEVRIAELTLILNIATKVNVAEEHGDKCSSLCFCEPPCDCKCDCWMSKVKKELCR